MSVNQLSGANRICRFDELTDPGSRAFIMGEGDWPLKGFVVRQGDDVFAYVNRCPHAGHPLNWQPHQFLTQDHTRLLCTSHGAQFEIDTGYCVLGPCAGKALHALRVKIVNGDVLLMDDPDELAARYA
jgi:nitrite reductase/ring-hydroxylating ferredoxin subunit